MLLFTNLRVKPSACGQTLLGGTEHCCAVIPIPLHAAPLALYDVAYNLQRFNSSITVLVAWLSHSLRPWTTSSPVLLPPTDSPPTRLPVPKHGLLPPLPRDVVYPPPPHHTTPTCLPHHRLVCGGGSAFFDAAVGTAGALSSNAGVIAGICTLLSSSPGVARRQVVSA